MPEPTNSGARGVTTTPQPARGNTTRRPRRRREQATFGAIDLGTNNCRLLIAKQTPDGFKVIDSYSNVVRLGEGLAATGRLSAQSMDAAIAAMTVCARKLKAKRVKRWRCVATQACRQADNCDEFLARVKAETGLSLEIISPRVESRLSVMGCLHLIDLDKDVALVVDIGGGSTELSWVDIRRLESEGAQTRIHRPPIGAWASLPLGVVTLSEQVPEYEPREQWYEQMKQAVRDAITEANSQSRFTNVFAKGQGYLIGTSGTITSLASVYQNLPYYQRDKIDGCTLPAAAAIKAARKISTMSIEERAQIPSIGADRAKMLVAGCAITDVICEMWPCENIRVADRGLREGILLGLMEHGKNLSELFAQRKAQEDKNGSGKATGHKTS